MAIDVSRARRETPGCFSIIHLHHSGSSQMPLPVMDAVRDHMELEQLRGGYEAEEEAGAKLANTYSALARMLNCRVSEIALMESATNAWNAAFYGIAQTFKEGDQILTSFSDYVSNMIAYMQTAKRYGVEVKIVPDSPNGQMSVRALVGLINDRVKLVSITHVPTHNGLVTPVKEIGAVVRAYGIPYLVDACQSAGQMPLNVDEIGCDALSGTGRKFLRGPRGTGFLYMRESALEKFPPAMLDLRSATWVDANSYELHPGALRYETFESNTACRIGLGVAVDYAMEWGLHDIYSRIRYLAEKMRHLLDEIPAVTLRDKGKQCCGIVTFTLDGFNATEVQLAMRKQGIQIGVAPRPNAVLDMDNWGVDSIVRSPVHYYNTEEEVEFFVGEVRKLAS